MYEESRSTKLKKVRYFCFAWGMITRRWNNAVGARLEDADNPTI